MATIPIRRFLVLALVAATAACGGGSSEPASGCTRAAIAPTGPGDVSNHFPIGVGSSWNFAVDLTTDTVTRSVTGTQPAGGETASVFTSTSAGSTTVELVVKRPSGVYALADASVDPLLAGAYPSLILPFPLAVAPATRQVTCTNLDVGDADGDGKADRADLSSWLGVLSTTETTSVAAGTFVDVAHVQTQATVNVRATAAGPLTITATQDDWYAPGVGLVHSRMELVVVGYGGDSQSMSLVSYSLPPPARIAPLARASAPPPGAPTRHASVEEAALAAARRLAR